MKKYWLFKTDPDSYSIDDLERDGQTFWNGVRNYQARNFMKEMTPGDEILFYHSQELPPAVVGIARVLTSSYPDPTFTGKDNPWLMVDIGFAKRFRRPVTLLEIKQNEALSGMRVRERGSRLSIQPVSHEHFDTITRLGNK